MRKVSQILERKGDRVVAVDADAPVLEAIRQMAEHHIGAVLVMRGQDLVGIASERDYARKVILQGRSSADTPVSAIMSAPVTCVGPQETVPQCMALMTDKHFRHLPVLTDDGSVVGMISIGDLVKETISSQQFLINELERYIAG